MAFDLSTAKPATGGFDLSTAKPVSQAPNSALQERFALDAKQQREFGGMVDNLENIVPGAIRGAASIGSTLMLPVDMVKDAIDGKGLSLDSNRARRAEVDAGLKTLGADPSSTGYKFGKLGGEVAGTAGVGPALATGLRVVAPGAGPLINAVQTGGMRAGTTPGALNMLARVTGGAINGGASAALVNPENAGTGAIVGGVLPPAMSVAGKIGNAAGRVLAGPDVAPEVRQAVADARNVGYVVPPTQAKPTLANRLLEGFSGKITTAQNASAKNQAVTNALAQKAVGATELSPSGLAQVRQQANAAYDALGQSTPFQADTVFHDALDKAGASTAELRKNFPELVNNEVDSLIQGLKSRPEFEAQPTIQAIKQFRASAAANKASTDPAKKALGNAQNKISNALEDMIDRNLQASGNPQLLNDYRDARQTLAKTYDVEKALNPSSGNIDANKLAQLAKKGRPLTGELAQIADFAGRFPKAVQSVDKMGSLPQFSPLDFGTLGTLAAMTSHPALLAGVAARPAARYAVLSDLLQNRLAQPSATNGLLNLMQNPDAVQAIYRAAPALGSSR